jgi:hypothetical protein
LEGLRCSGLPETFNFDLAGGLSARPTLSVLVRSSTAITQRITLSYLSRGFDWAADYTATLSADGKTLNLGAWVTLANANGVSFPSAHTQVVAGRVNREADEVVPIDVGGPIMAQCWPRGSTSDSPGYLRIERAVPLGFEGSDAMGFARSMHLMAAPEADLAEVAVTAQTSVRQEQLGDLKLYRVPDRTTVASRQSKQVRLMDRAGVPIRTVYGADLDVGDNPTTLAASRRLRTKNTAANHLGLPLPSGSVAVFSVHDGQRLLLHESAVRDLALNEEVEIDLGESSDVQLSTATRKIRADSAREEIRTEISNARDTAIQFELRLRLRAGEQLLRADHPMATKDGRPIFRLEVPANSKIALTYQTGS